MLTRLRATVGIAAATLAFAAPAIAQTQSDDARFQAAQQRLDRELQLFQQEFDRYQSTRTSRGPGGYRPAPTSDPRYSGGAGNGGYADAGSADDRDEQGYDASRYYRVGPNYQERTLGANDRVYAGTDGRYYCKRSDGTTGLIVGGAAGGVLGNVIDGGHSRTAGTLLGAAVGALAGRAVDQNQSQVRCR